MADIALDDAGQRLAAGARRLETLYAGFSYPRPEFAPALDELVPMICREYVAALTDAWLDRHEAQIETRSDGLLDLLRSWAQDPGAVPGSGWDIAFGNLYRTLGMSDADPAALAAGVACHLG